jgi:hypothetical protein
VVTTYAAINTTGSTFAHGSSLVCAVLGAFGKHDHPRFPRQCPTVCVIADIATVKRRRRVNKLVAELDHCHVAAARPSSRRG